MWQTIIPIVGGLLDKIIPDSKQAADAKVKLVELAQAGELAALDADTKIALAQAGINTEEVKTDAFRGGWRPAIGWCCAAGFAYHFLLRPLLPWMVGVAGYQVQPLPALDIDSLMVLATGMLGLGGLRSLERIKGKA